MFQTFKSLKCTMPLISNNIVNGLQDNVTRGGRRKKFRGGGGVKKIRIITVMPVFKNLAPSGILFY
jgi:hypothetical protein